MGQMPSIIREVIISSTLSIFNRLPTGISMISLLINHPFLKFIQIVKCMRLPAKTTHARLINEETVIYFPLPRLRQTCIAKGYTSRT